MSEMCKRCLAGNEDIPAMQSKIPCPSGCCIVCWVRYGRFIPVCRTGRKIMEEKSDEN